jgi:very-short-patch-repair endonuclease
MTLPEVALWRELRGGRLKGCRFRRQHPVGPYILDFYCPAVRLAVEIDGAVHEGAAQARHDTHRDQWLRYNGITVLRVAASDVLGDEKLETVLRHIELVAAPSTIFAALDGPPPP